LQVVELEIQLDEIKEQYNNVIRNSNSKAQQKKMAFLERNLEQLTLVQKQVRVPGSFSIRAGFIVPS
jgi:kinesin family protein 5